MARLHLARGEVEFAATLLHPHIAQHGEGVLGAPVLALLAEVVVAAGRVEELAPCDVRPPGSGGPVCLDRCDYGTSLPQPRLIRV